MKIGIQTWGSDGDIRPMIALAGGLRKAGHDVLVSVGSVDGKDYGALARALGFRIIHTPVPHGHDLIDTARRIKLTNDPIKQVKLLIDENFLPFQERMLETGMEMAEASDLLIGHHLLGGLKAAAEKHHRTYVSVFFCHSFIPSRHTTPDPFPNMGTFINRLMWKAGDLFMEPVITKHFNRIRRNIGLPPLDDLLFTGWKSDSLNIIAASPQLSLLQPDWDATHQVSGFLDIPLAAEMWDAPPALRRFLDDGEPPVYMTFGSMTQFELNGVTELFIEAARLSGKRAIIQSNWDAVKPMPEHPAIFRIGKAPHHAILPHCALAVHHGGAGTTHSATYCGLPSVVVAHAFDQSVWGKALKRVGIGGKVLNIRTVTPQKLAAEIRAMYANETAREKAHAIGALVRQENGVSRAVELVEKAAL